MTDDSNSHSVSCVPGCTVSPHSMSLIGSWKLPTWSKRSFPTCLSSSGSQVACAFPSSSGHKAGMHLDRTPFITGPLPPTTPTQTGTVWTRQCSSHAQPWDVGGNPHSLGENVQIPRTLWPRLGIIYLFFINVKLSDVIQGPVLLEALYICKFIWCPE